MVYFTHQKKLKNNDEKMTYFIGVTLYKEGARNRYCTKTTQIVKSK